jgi:hypothetical protein
LASERRANAFTQLQVALPQRNSVDLYFTVDGTTAPTFTISAEARTAHGARYRRDALVRVLEDGAAPFQLLEWRRPHFADAGGY